jgi:hypothetical protein
MTNLEIRNFAYDTISSYLFDNHTDFCYSLYDEIRAGGTIESAVEKYLKENYENIGNVRRHLGDVAFQWHALTSERCKIFSLACDIIIECIGVEHILDVEELVTLTNIRDNYREGFITLEECANKIVDSIPIKRSRPSIYLVDSVFAFIGLPRFHDCIDTRYTYLSR